MITNFSGLGYYNSSGIDYNKLASGNFSTARYLSRLASTESRGAIIMLKNNLRKEIYKINKSGGDEQHIKSAVARIRNVIKKADEKIMKLNSEKRIIERAKQAEYAEKIQEELSTIRKYNSTMHNRKLSERLNVMSAAVCENKDTENSDNYAAYTNTGVLENYAPECSGTSIDAIM